MPNQSSSTHHNKGNPKKGIVLSSTQKKQSSAAGHNLAMFRYKSNSHYQSYREAERGVTRAKQPKSKVHKLPNVPKKGTTIRTASQLARRKATVSNTDREKYQLTLKRASIRRAPGTAVHTELMQHRKSAAKKKKTASKPAAKKPADRLVMKDYRGNRYPKSVPKNKRAFRGSGKYDPFA